jgi:hypothetical protein
MTLPTGVAAIGENNYGNPDGALWYLNKMTKTFSYVFQERYMKFRQIME